MDEKLLTLAEVKEILESEEKIRELNTEQKYALEHARTFARISGKDARAMVKELTELPFVTERHACKIADLLVQHPDDIRAVFIKERYTPTEEDVRRVAEIVSKHI